MAHGGNSWGFFSLDSLISNESTYYTWVKYKGFWKIVWIWSHHLHIQWKFKLWAGKFTWGVKAKHCCALSTNFWKQKVCWHRSAISCLISSSKLSHQWFEFSLKVKVMWSNPGYLPKSFLLYIMTKRGIFI